MRIFIIQPVRNITQEELLLIEDYAKMLEDEGNEVYVPHRDTNQKDLGINICEQNRKAISEADQVHVYYNSSSTGTHFDMGIAFAYNKKIVIIKNEPFNEQKSFARFLWEYSENIKEEK